MRCPRCQKEVKAKDHYCPHCGYDLWRQKQPSKRPFPQPQKQLPIVLIILVVLLTGVSAYYLIDREQKNSTYMIGIYALRSVSRDVYTFNSLEDFQVKIENAETFVAPMRTYTKSLEEIYDLAFTPSYHIVVTTDNNVNVTLTHTAQIDEATTLTIERRYDRGDLDDITIKMTKEGCHSFEDLRQAEHEALMKQILGTKIYEKLTAAFDQKAALFESKGSQMSHYGMGVYEGQEASKVIYRHKDIYSSVVTKYAQGDRSLRV